MRGEAEPRHIPERNFARLDRVAERVRPQDPGLAEWVTRYSRQHRQRLAADLWILEHHAPARARVLECGAVPLLMTGALAELEYDVSALDLAPERFTDTIAELGLDVRRCDLEKEPAPFADDTFDVAIFHELFEHLRVNPIATLREVRRVLKPGGTLLLSTPNLRSFRGLRNLLLHNRGHACSGGIYQQYEKLESLGHMGHVREYTTLEVREFLVRLGFRIERLIYRGGHGRGFVGLAERLAPSLRPFFSLVAVKDESP